MHPVLLRTAHFFVGSYSFMVLTATVLAVVGVMLRTRRGHLDQPLLSLTMMLAMVGGWFSARVLPLLLDGQWQRLRWGLLLPGGRGAASLSYFLLIALPIVLLCLLRRRRLLLPHLDALAPSLLLGLAVAKIGCLLAGCCAGGLCSAAWGTRYPYGSDVYAEQWRGRLLAPAAVLIWSDADGHTRLLGHADYLVACRDSPPPALQRQAAAYGLSFAELVELARKERSLPVWPVPLWYIVAAGLCWLVAERVYRRSRCPGLTSGLVLVAYAVMRLAFDGFVPSTGSSLLTLSPSQLVAIPIGFVGVALLLRVWGYNFAGRPG